MVNNSIEKKGKESAEAQTQQAITVSQPKKLESILETINLMNTISERIGESKSGDLGGTGIAGKKQGAQSGQSQRDQAIADLPSAPVMQKQLQKHIRTEVKNLQKEIRIAARKVSKPGSANKLNELYARIRRLNGILHELFSTSVDVIKRLYIRVFVDKQTVFQ